MSEDDIKRMRSDAHRAHMEACQKAYNDYIRARAAAEKRLYEELEAIDDKVRGGEVL